MPVAISPASSSNAFILCHETVHDFLAVALRTLLDRELSSNIILAHALKIALDDKPMSDWHCLDEKAAGEYAEKMASSRGTFYSSRDRKDDSFWFTVWSSPSPFVTPTLDIVLASVSNPLGDYPIFLWTPKHPATLSSSWLSPKLSLIVDSLLSRTSPTRVFSVFGMTALIKNFASQWTEATDVQLEAEPFYAASYTYCTRETFQDSDRQLPHDHSIRRATMDDLEGVAQLCKEFADDSVYFPLALDRARIEAEELITKGLIWIHTSPSGEPTTICAVTRSSPNVSAITKVYTTPRWRRRGYAEAIVRHVTRRLLMDYGKQVVSLYVGHTNTAQRVYDRCGFVGLCGKAKVDGVEDSLELGFVTGAPRGHW